ncbi:MAG: insulinase family protein [Ruminococcaceae bacterium]|nr:insulinase family protein [Oscillospiraceae bacterium]
MMERGRTMMNNNCSVEIKSDLLHEKYELIHHKSGLDIYVFPKNTTTSYALFATHYGSIDNDFMLQGENSVTSVPSGIAHFLEHKMFTREDGSDAFERFSELGADANAYTSYDKTVFLFSCTSNFKECLSELIDFVTHPFFTDESVKKEQGIIAEEIGMYDDAPPTRCYYGMLRGLYEKHDIKTNICGTVESISQITPELLYRCHEVFYNLSNMVLVVCGNVTAEDVLSVADRPLSGNEPLGIVRGKVVEPPFAVRERTVQKMQLAKPVFDIGIKDTEVPTSSHERMKREIAMSIVTDLLFSQTGELYGKLYEMGLISPGLSCAYTVSETFGFCEISGESDDPDKVYAIIKEYFLKKREEGFTEEEFERCRKVFYSSFVRGLDSAEDIANDLMEFVFDGYDYFGYADMILSITLCEVMEIFRSSFAENCFTLSAVFPLDEQ